VDDDILSVAEAARYMKVSEHTIRRAIADGTLPAAKLRGQYRIQKSDLTSLFRRQNQRSKKKSK
jgi:excisionase family DNA binding protein